VHTDRQMSALVGRRNFLRLGGAGVASAAVLSACGGTDSPGVARVGTAPTTTQLPDAVVTDGVLMRTAASIERSVIGLYSTVLDAELIPASLVSTVERFRDDHVAHAEALDELTAAAGSEPWLCGNPRIEELLIPAILTAINGDEAAGIAPTDDPARDALNTAHVFESLATETYQSYMSQLSSPALRRAAIAIGADEARHSSLLALAITGRPAGYLQLEAPESPPAIPVAYALPSRFGTLGGLTLVIGAEDEVGLRRSISLETPSLNTFVYDFVEPSC
jgi:Ferritin-like domain